MSKEKQSHNYTSDHAIAQLADAISDYNNREFRDLTHVAAHFGDCIPKEASSSSVKFLFDRTLEKLQEHSEKPKNGLEKEFASKCILKQIYRADSAPLMKFAGNRFVELFDECPPDDHLDLAVLKHISNFAARSSDRKLWESSNVKYLERLEHTAKIKPKDRTIALREFVESLAENPDLVVASGRLSRTFDQYVNTPENLKRLTPLANQGVNGAQWATSEAIKDTLAVALEFTKAHKDSPLEFQFLMDLQNMQREVEACFKQKSRFSATEDKKVYNETDAQKRVDKILSVGKNFEGDQYDTKRKELLGRYIGQVMVTDLVIDGYAREINTTLAQHLEDNTVLTAAEKASRTSEPSSMNAGLFMALLQNSQEQSKEMGNRVMKKLPSVIERLNHRVSSAETWDEFAFHLGQRSLVHLAHALNIYANANGEDDFIVEQQKDFAKTAKEYVHIAVERHHNPGRGDESASEGFRDAIALIKPKNIFANELKKVVNEAKRGFQSYKETAQDFLHS